MVIPSSPSDSSRTHITFVMYVMSRIDAAQVEIMITFRLSCRKSQQAPSCNFMIVHIEVWRAKFSVLCPPNSSFSRIPFFPEFLFSQILVFPGFPVCFSKSRYDAKTWNSVFNEKKLVSLCSLPVGHVRNIAENSIYCVTFINSWFFHTPVFRLSYLLYHIHLSIHVLDSPSIFHLTNSFIPSFTFAPIRLVKAIHLSLRNVHLHFTSSQNKKWIAQWECAQPVN